jgi:hypothetical protein
MGACHRTREAGCGGHGFPPVSGEWSWLVLQQHLWSDAQYTDHGLAQLQGALPDGDPHSTASDDHLIQACHRQNSNSRVLAWQAGPVVRVYSHAFAIHKLSVF